METMTKQDELDKLATFIHEMNGTYIGDFLDENYGQIKRAIHSDLIPDNGFKAHLEAKRKEANQIVESARVTAGQILADAERERLRANRDIQRSKSLVLETLGQVTKQVSEI